MAAVSTSYCNTLAPHWSITLLALAAHSQKPCRDKSTQSLTRCLCILSTFCVVHGPTWRLCSLCGPVSSTDNVLDTLPPAVFCSSRSLQLLSPSPPYPHRRPDLTTPLPAIAVLLLTGLYCYSADTPHVTSSAHSTEKNPQQSEEITQEKPSTALMPHPPLAEPH